MINTPFRLYEGLFLSRSLGNRPNDLIVIFLDQTTREH
jgi:hypothetical protein